MTSWGLEGSIYFFKVSISGSLTVNLHCQLDRFWNHLGDTLLWGHLQRRFTEKRSPALNPGSEISWIGAPNRVKSREEDGAHWRPASISFCFLTVTAVWPAFPAVMNSIYKWDEHKPFFLSLWVFFFSFCHVFGNGKETKLPVQGDVNKLSS